MSYNTIVVSGDPQVREKTSSAAITPGELLAISSGALVPHATAGGNAVPKMIAVENDLIGNDIDDDWLSGDKVQYVVPRPGDELYMFLADGQNVSDGDVLESDGNGDLQAHTPLAIDEGGVATPTVYTQAVVCIAREDLDNSAGGARARILVQIV